MPEENLAAEIWQIIRELGEGQKQLQEAQRRTEEAHKRTEEAQQRTEEAQRRTEEAQRRTEEALQSTQAELKLLSQELRASIKEMDRAWGKLANKLGTVLEDITAPNIERFATEEFGFPAVRDLFVRAKRTSSAGPERRSEFDVICTGPGKVVYAEMKSTPSLASIAEFRTKLGEFFDFFPEYRACELVGVYASWSLEKRFRLAISAAGLYGVTMGDETMEIVARPSPPSRL